MLPARRAFTLLELVVVLVVLAVLAALAIPTFARVTRASKLKTAETTLAALARDARAIDALDSTDSLESHVRTAVAELSAASASAGLGAAASSFKLAWGSGSYSSGSSVISATLDGDTLGLALGVDGGCAYALSTGPTEVRTWSVDPANDAQCSGSGSVLSEEDFALLLPPATPAGLRVRWVQGTGWVVTGTTETLDLWVDGEPGGQVSPPATGPWVISEFRGVTLSELNVLRLVPVSSTGGPITPVVPAPVVAPGPRGSVVNVQGTWPSTTTALDLVCTSRSFPVAAGSSSGYFDVTGGDSCELRTPSGDPWPLVLTPTSAPPAPTPGGTSMARFDGRVDVRFTPVPSRPLAPLGGYLLERRHLPSSTWEQAYRGTSPRDPALTSGEVQVLDSSTSPNDVTLPVHPLLDSGVWCYRVSAFGPGGSSAPGPEACVDTTSSAADFSVTAGPSAATLSWLPDVSVSGYTLSVTPAPLAGASTRELVAGSSGTAVTDLAPGTEYSFTLTATRDGRAAVPVTKSVTTALVPAGYVPFVKRVSVPTTLADGFNRANSTDLGAVTTSTGASQAWQQITGGFRITTNAAHATNSSTSSVSMAVVDMGTTEQVVRIQRPNPTYTGSATVVLRYTDAHNYVYAYVNSTSTAIREVKAGNDVLLASNTATGYKTILVRASASTVELWGSTSIADLTPENAGAPKLTGTSTNAVKGTGAGLYARYGTYDRRADEFSAAPVGEALLNP
jgi:prepilin-type N-terminal cleavage/methylation domain-containing protein